MTVVGFADPGRTSGKGPWIVGFELAGSAAKAKAILEAWGESGRKVAAFKSRVRLLLYRWLFNLHGTDVFVGQRPIREPTAGAAGYATSLVTMDRRASGLRGKCSAAHNSLSR